MLFTGQYGTIWVGLPLRQFEVTVVLPGNQKVNGRIDDYGVHAEFIPSPTWLHTPDERVLFLEYAGRLWREFLNTQASQAIKPL